MTTIYKEDVECSVCGTTESQSFLGSTSAFGSADLDTRPPELERSTLAQRIYRCSKCLYCSSDLTTCSEETVEIVQSSEYQDIVGNTSLPETASSFLALSFLSYRLQEYQAAAWSAISAAWICDDHGLAEDAISCRLKALELINEGLSGPEKLAHQEGASEAITIDLMRRAGLFEEAKQVATSINTSETDETIAKVIAFAIHLIDKRDDGIYTIKQALE